MDFSFTSEQLTFRQQVLEFAQELVEAGVEQRDRDCQFDWQGWRQCAEFGIQRMAAPAAYGGKTDCELMTAMLVMEAMGEGCRDNGLTFALNAHMWTVQSPLAQFGSDAQKQKYLPLMASGQWIGAHAMTEADFGSDAYSLQTHAQKVEGGYRITGNKTLITFAPVADLFLLFATVNPEIGKWGVTAFLVEKKFAGVEVSGNKEKMGLRTVPIGDLQITDCFVPEENRLGTEGAGVAISTQALEIERCCILASQLGAMQFQLQRSIEYARSRRQSGQPIGKFQSVSNRIADMKVRLETARLLLHKVAWLKQQGKSAMMEAAILKLYLSEQFVESSLDAVRVHGGYGYLTETGVERDLRDAVGAVLYAGTSDIQRNIIAGLLGL